MTVPAFIGHAHKVVALVAKLGLIGVAIHAGPVQAHEIRLIVGRPVIPHPIPYDSGPPILQQRFVISLDEGFRFNTLLFVFVGRELELRSIARLSTCRVVPDRGGNKGQEDEQTGNNLAFVVHLKLRSKSELTYSPPARPTQEGLARVAEFAK